VKDLTELPAETMARRVRKGKLSATALVRAHLGRIERLNPLLNAYIELDAERALEAARRLDEGDRSGLPLAGVPISIKSSISVAGLRWDCGSRLRDGARSETDAPLVRRLRAAGAIVLGVTNVPEFLVAWETDNSVYGRTNSPWDLAYTAGGSSGGESAAVAARLSAGGVGSDGGGSIRVPAHFTGICGLKPTPGRVPTTGHFPVSAGPFASLGVVGPMARNLTDLQLLYNAMAGPDDGDPCAAPAPVETLKKKSIKKLTIGYFETDGQTPVTPETRAALRRAREALEEEGFTVRDFTPSGLGEIYQLWWNLFGRGVGALLEPMIREHELDLSPILRQFNGYVKNSPPLTRDDLMDTLLRRDAARTRLLGEMRRFPVLLCPVAATAAFRHGEREWTIEGRRVSYLDAWSYTAWFNLTGNPAVSVPIPGVAERPHGVQLVGRPWAEASILGIASRLEKSLGTHPAPPVDLLAE
jgi:Asp-tRNA(Asn)/Glu-tRNA(Gln) amidotransferase A subunit family amidase